MHRIPHGHGDRAVPATTIRHRAPMTDHDRPVDPTPPAGVPGILGTDHITVEGSNLSDTIEFYRDLLGMPLVLTQPNLDRSHLTHLFFDTGDGRMLTFFASDDRESADVPNPAPGQVHHLAFRIERGRKDEIADRLRDAGYPVSEFDRGVFHSLYTEDNNGLGVELVTDKFGLSEDRRGEVLALAQQMRIDDGATYVQESHMYRAIDELGLDASDWEGADAPTGRDV